MIDDDDEYDDQPRRGWLSWLVVTMSWTVSAALVVLVLLLGLIVELHRPGPQTANGADRTVVIPRGEGVSEIARRLERIGAVRNPFVFRIGAEIYGRDGSLKAGEYAIASGESPRTILDKMLAGRVLLHLVTIPEGWTSAMIVEKLANADVLTGPTPAVPPEGALMPETYNVERGNAREAVIAKMAEAHQEALARLWPRRAPNLPFSTPREAVILASIVEKETGVAAERPRVASVFVNRLRKGMRLETDPTIIYGVCKVDPDRCVAGRLVDEKTGATRGIRRSELAMDTGYNTYRIYGLPPTPIANPGLASLEAVLNPASTGDLYFVADGTGGHVFASTLAEHQKNVAKWRAIEKARAN